MQQQIETIPAYLLSVKQVAELLGLSRPKVYALIATEGLPVVPFGRAIRVRPSSLQRWLDLREKGLSA